jgi:FKBP-type peptidyl-prolyl cis-trans isomerase
MRLFVLFYFVGIVSLLWSCGDDNVDPNAGNSEDSTIVSYLDSMGIDYQLDDAGIYYYPIKLNPTGKSQLEGNVLSIYYQLDVLGGQNLITVDSRDGDPIRLKQGAKGIYPFGIDSALNYMKEGEEWEFLIPSRLGFVNYSSVLIPENAILIFKANLKRIQNENDIQFEDIQKLLQYSDSVKLTDTVANPLNQPILLNNGMIYKRLIAGDPTGLKPSLGNELTITYTASLPYQESNPIDLQHASNANPFIYSFNDNVVIAGLDAGVAQMTTNETALLVIPSLLAYRESAMVLPDYLTQEMVDMKIIPAYAAKVRPYEVLIFEVTLLEIN